MNRILLGLTLLIPCVTGCVTTDPVMARDVGNIATRYNNAVTTSDVPLLIYNVASDPPNTAGGVGIWIGFVNSGTKTIKYLDFDVTVLNRVGDPAVCSVRRTASRRLHAVGPFEPGVPTQSTGIYWDAIVYNSAAVFVRIDRVSIDYMDGTTDRFDADEVGQLLAEPRVNDFASGFQQTFTVSLRMGKEFILQRKWWVK